MNQLFSWFRNLGPGMVFAATAVGTSHLVQSTRAGAGYGIAIGIFIILACLLKYPAFRFGSDYAAATRQSLVDNYFAQGRWAVGIFMLELAVTMFVFTAAVALVSAGLVNQVFGLSLSIVLVAGGLMVLCILVLWIGGYSVFERITKSMVLLLALILVFAVAVTLPKVDLTFVQSGADKLFDFDTRTIFFLIALAGFMPSGMGQSVFQSLWVNERSRIQTEPRSFKQTRHDFNIGYSLTMVLALGFLVLGTVLMFQPGVAVSNSGTAFAGQLISLFTESLGGYVYPFISLAAIVVMLSSLIALMDSCSRALDATLDRIRRGSGQFVATNNRTNYLRFLLLQAVGSMVILALFMQSFKSFIDLATSVAFLTAPLIAILNHRAISSPEVAAEFRPSTAIKLWSLLGILIMSLLSLYYLSTRLF